MHAFLHARTHTYIYIFFIAGALVQMSCIMRDSLWGPPGAPHDQFNLVTKTAPPPSWITWMSWIPSVLHRSEWTGLLDWNEKHLVHSKPLNLSATDEGVRMMGLTWKFIYGLVPFGSFYPAPHSWLVGPQVGPQIVSHCLLCKTSAPELSMAHIL